MDFTRKLPNAEAVQLTELLKKLYWFSVAEYVGSDKLHSDIEDLVQKMIALEDEIWHKYQLQPIIPADSLYDIFIQEEILEELPEDENFGTEVGEYYVKLLVSYLNGFQEKEYFERFGHVRVD